MKKFSLLPLVAAAALTLPMAAQAQKIGLAMAELDTFLTILKNGTVDAAKKAGATVQVEDAQADVGKQLSQIQNLIAQKVDAIIVNPVDTDATPKITKMVTDAKIPLVYVNRKPVDFEKLSAGVAFVRREDFRHAGNARSLPPAQGQGRHPGADG
jgi:inositol transport system substrate-binding protein